MADTQILSVHVLRRSAEARERDLQRALAAPSSDDRLLRDVPDWARGVRVEKAGRFQWAVVATEHRGH